MLTQSAWQHYEHSRDKHNPRFQAHQPAIKTRPDIQVLAMPWHALPWSTRVHNAFAHWVNDYGISTVRDLCYKLDEHRLIRTKNFGYKSLYEVRDILAKHGLRLGIEYDAQSEEWYWGA